MLNSKLLELTPEQRQEHLAKAKLAKEAKKAYAEANLKLDWQDENYWRETCQQLGVRLPQRYDVGTRGIKKIAKKFGVDVNEFVESTGFSTMKQFEAANPAWPAFALAGVFVEWYIDNMHQKYCKYNI